MNRGPGWNKAANAIINDIYLRIPLTKQLQLGVVRINSYGDWVISLKRFEVSWEYSTHWIHAFVFQSDDVMTSKRFPHYWSYIKGNHTKDQWCGALMLSWMLDKSNYQWVETPWRSCDVAVIQIYIYDRACFYRVIRNIAQPINWRVVETYVTSHQWPHWYCLTMYGDILSHNI